MSERYWITGVQIGMLKIFKEKLTDKTFEEIVENQFIGNMQEPYENYEIVIKKKRRVKA